MRPRGAAALQGGRGGKQREIAQGGGEQRGRRRATVGQATRAAPATACLKARCRAGPRRGGGGTGLLGGLTAVDCCCCIAMCEGRASIEAVEWGSGVASTSQGLAAGPASGVQDRGPTPAAERRALRCGALSCCMRQARHPHHPLSLVLAGADVLSQSVQRGCLGGVVRRQHRLGLLDQLVGDLQRGGMRAAAQLSPGMS